MKRSTLMFPNLVVAVAAVLYLSVPVAAQEEPIATPEAQEGPAAASEEQDEPVAVSEVQKTPVSEDKAAMDPAQEEMMAKWKEYSTPAENHAVLNMFVGQWDHTVKMWMKPGSEPDVSTGQTETQWIIGGRYLQQKAQGTSMGMPFEGLLTLGYDNAKKEYFSLWIDNMGTGLMQGRSQYNTETKTFIEEGSHSCPLETDHDRWFRSVTRFINEDQYTYEVFSKDEKGNDFLMLEITYSRKK